jgi:hypothetical protein
MKKKKIIKNLGLLVHDQRLLVQEQRLCAFGHSEEIQNAARCEQTKGGGESL